MRHQVVHNRGHGFPKDLSLQGCTTFCPHVPTTLNAWSNLFLWRPAEGGWLHSIHAHIYPWSIRWVLPAFSLGMNPIAATYSISNTTHYESHFNKSSNSHPNGNSQTRGPMDRCAHASSFVRITHTLQRVVCTLSLGSKSRTTGLGSARQN